MVSRAYDKLVEHMSAMPMDFGILINMATESIMPQVTALAEDKGFERAVDWIRRGEKAVWRKNAAAAAGA